MKKLLLILFLFAGYTSFSQGKIGGEGNVIPTGSYPIVQSKDIKGGLHKFQTIAERDALPANFKDSGMLGYVVDSLKYYKWNGATWEEFKTGSDAPTDYFTSYTQAPDSSYLQTNRKDGTKQYVVIEADGLTGGGSGGITWEQSLQNQGETAFTTDNTVDFGGHEFNINNFSTLNFSSDINSSFANGNASIGENNYGVGLNYTNDSSESNIATQTITPNIASASLQASNYNTGKTFNVVVTPDQLKIDNSGDTTYINIDNLPTGNADPNNIAWFDEHNILHRGSINIDSTVTLSSGTITVSDTRVKTGARIFVSCNTPSGTQGFLSAKTSDIVDGTSFIINSTSATDNSTINYTIHNP